ncbi:MAG: phosphatase PAP2 family protein [Armatimonadota bacterium]
MLSMRIDFWLFDRINGLAGWQPWLDTLGRYLAVYGLLVILLFALGVLWWPRLPAERRRRYFGALLTGLAACALLAGLELLLAPHISLRSRPFNARWVTLLITGESELSFPAWPLVYAWALIVPTLSIARRAGIILIALGVLFGLAMVFVGLNYPLDILFGSLLGAAVGMTFALLFKVSAITPKRPWLLPTIAWVVLLLIGGLLRIFLQPASTMATTEMVPTRGLHVRVATPAATLAALQRITAPSEVTIDAATNGHLLVAWAQVKIDSDAYTLAGVEDQARRVVNAAFSTWRQLDLLTVTVSAAFPGEKDQKLGTLYTATIERRSWPPAGVPSAQALPGEKFYHHRFLGKPASGLPGKVVSPNPQ